MSEGKWYVVARVTSKPGCEDALRSLLLELLEPSRQDSGCLRYELFENHVVPSEFVFLEEWSSEEDIEAHLDSPHVQEAFLEGSDLLAAPPDIRRYHRLA